MKNFKVVLFSAMCVLFFVGCADRFGMETDSSNSGKVSVSAGRAVLPDDGAGYSIKLEFVTPEPDHQEFVKEKLLAGNASFDFGGVAIDTELQFKISIFRNGKLVFEGLTNKDKVKSKETTTFTVEDWTEIHDYLMVDLCKYGVDEIEDYYYKSPVLIDENWNDISTMTWAEMKATGIPLLNDDYMCFAYCMDSKRNIYLAAAEEAYDESTWNLIRFSAPYYDNPVILINGKVNEVTLDPVRDDLYYEEWVSDEKSKIFKIENPDTFVPGKDSPKGFSKNSNGYYDSYILAMGMGVIYDGYYYTAQYKQASNETVLLKIRLDDFGVEDDSIVLMKYSSQNGIPDEISGIFEPQASKVISALEDVYKSTGGTGIITYTCTSLLENYGGKPVNSDTAAYNEVIATKNGLVIPIAISTHNYNSLYSIGLSGNIPETDYSIILLLDPNNPSKAKLLGGPEGYFCGKNGENFVFCAEPKSTDTGLFGRDIPLVAIKPKELVFFNSGAWIYVENGKGKLKAVNHYATLDLEKETLSFADSKVEAVKIADTSVSYSGGGYKDSSEATYSFVGF